VSQKKSLLQVLLELLNIIQTLHVSSPLDKTELISLVVPVVRGAEQSLVETGLDLVRGLLGLKGNLDHKEVEMLAEHVKQLALSHGNVTVREKACDTLEYVASRYPRIIGETILPPLLQLFTLDASSSPMETDKVVEVESREVSLLAISRLLVSLAAYPDLQELILPAFLAALEQLAERSFTQEHADTAEAVAGHLCRVVEKTVSRTSLGLHMVQKTVVNRVLLLCIAPSLTSPSTRHVFTEEAVLQQCFSLLRTFTLAANKTVNVKESWATLIREIFLDNASSILPQSSSFLPLMPSSLPVQTRLVSILTFTVGAMTRETVGSQAPVYLPRLLEHATLCPDKQSSRQSAMCYASIVSKIDKPEDLQQFLSPAMSSLWQSMTDDSRSEHEARARALTAWLWLTKALVVRSHPLGKTAALKLFDLFGDPHLSSEAADGFSVILKDNEIVFGKNLAITKLMHRQKFCLEVVPELVKRFSEAEPGQRQYFLRALAHILQNVPRQVLLEQLPLLHPLLLESLNSEEPGLSQSTLEGLHTILQNAASASAMTDHLPSLVPRLLELASRPDSMRTRCSALSCLNGLSKLPRHLVFPYQSQVLRELVPCLDDSKRLVRKEAVQTRANWFMLDTV
jgi:DNA repair/transcription protein MET18/MMS19